jgi:lactoylglutathione lyase
LGVIKSASEVVVFSHVFVGVSDFERALAFYNPLMESLGIEARFCERSRPWAGWQSTPGPRPLFIVGKPYNQLAPQPGNGNMVAFLAEIRAH